MWNEKFVNRLELEKIIKAKYGNEELDWVRRREKGNTPGRFENIYDRVGAIIIWNSVGDVVEEIGAYKPKKGGSVVYLVEA